MKRTLFFMLLSAWLSAPATWAEDFVVDGIYYNILSSDDKTVEVTTGNYSGDVTILATVTYEGSEYRVTAIGDKAFYFCTGLTSVMIPNSVTSIGEEAFYFCTGLTSVTIPESVQTIGRDAFYGCSGLTSVTIGKGVTTIGVYAFCRCNSLTSVTIGKGVTTIGVYAFCRCNSLTSVTIGEGVQTIGGYAFEGCSGLTSVTAYNPTPVDIGTSVFYGVDNCKLYVPKGSVEAYRNAEGWSAFGEILPIDESSAITEIRQDNADGHITVYNLQGVLVLETNDAAALKTLQNGAYIVNGKKMVITR